MKTSKSMNLLEGSLWDKILVFAIPYALTCVLQQLFTATDVAVVGRFVGNQAMGAVGANTPLIGLFINFFSGISLGANVVISNAIGRKDSARIEKAIHTAVLFSIICGVVLIVIGETLAKNILLLMSVPDDVIDMASLYFRVYFFGMPVIILYNFLASIFRSMGDTRTPLLALTLGGIANVFFNLFFVIVIHMTVDGVALGTVISNAVSSIILITILSKREEPYTLHFKKLSIDTQSLKSMLAIGVPSGVEGSIFALSNTVVQSAINSLGSTVMAGSAAAFNTEIIGFYVLNSFGQACTTFTAQNNGAGKEDRCKKALGWSLLLGGIFTFITCALMLIFGHPLLSLFSKNEEVIEVGMIRMEYIFAGYTFNLIQEVMAGALRGYGHSLVPALCALIGICGTRILWVNTYFKVHKTFAALVTAYPVSLCITAIAVVIVWIIYAKSGYYFSLCGKHESPFKAILRNVQGSKKTSL